MKLLFWVPPWPSQDDPIFFKNCTEKFLIPQANMLAAAGCEVEFVLPSVFEDLSSHLRAKGVTRLALPEAVEGIIRPDIYESLYQRNDESLLSEIEGALRGVLSDSYDAVFLWENPVPFLISMYPDVPILHQMPGAFARAPYPSTLTVDPAGLYRDGLLHRDAQDIQKFSRVGALDRAEISKFLGSAKSLLSAGDDTGIEDVLSAAGQFRSYKLLPLQVSKHYAFKCDTGLSGQLDFLLKTLQGTSRDVGVVVTQYIHRLTSERVLTAESAESLRRQYPNLIYSERFDEVDSVSQKLLAHVDGVETASSSLGVQAIGFGLDLKVPYETFLQNYSSNMEVGDLSWGERCRHTIEFSLSRYQPLASLMRDDADFVMRYVSELKKWKQKSSPSAVDLPAFSDLYGEYWDLFLNSFQKMPQKKSGKAKSVSIALSEFREKVSGKKAVTFDIFDTLVKRSVEKPGDLYKFLEPEVYRITNGKISHFARIRGACERSCREAVEQGDGSFDEILLDDIYSEMQRRFHLSEAIVEEIKRAEIEMEVKFCSRREHGVKLLDIAKSSGKSIHLISDMYLSREVILRLLEKAGISGYDKFFLSADIGLRKHDGRLFEHVLSELKLKGSDVLHVGDNRKADGEMAEKNGIEPFLWPASIENLRKNKRYKAVYNPRSGAGHRARSAVAGLTAHALFDSADSDEEFSTLFAGDAFKLGFAAIGPILTGYVSWIRNEADRDGISDLYFFSREGYILKRVYDELFASDKSAPRAHYFYTSRRCVRVAALRQDGDVIDLASEPYDPGVILGKLFLGRFGIELSDIEDASLLQRCGFSSASVPIDNDPDTKMRFVQLVVSKGAEILENAKAEREAYSQYIESTGYLTCESPGVVDVGWKANIQGALGDLAARKSIGYYYAATSDASLWRSKGYQHRSYLGPYITEASSPSAVVLNRHLFEHLTCHTDPTLISFKLEGGRAEPVFKAEIDRHVRKAFIGRVHDGVAAFAREFQHAYTSQMSDITLDPYLCEGVFASFVQSPSKEDLRLFDNQVFEDVVGGVDAKKVAPGSASKPKGRKIAVSNEYLVDRSMFEAFEEIFVRLIVNEAKHKKYLKNRVRFFRDSKLPTELWLSVTTKEGV